MPGPGQIGVFDRSHYEDVLIVKVNALVSAEELDGRYEQINAFESELVASGTPIVKVMLHISNGRAEGPAHGPARPSRTSDTSTTRVTSTSG